MTAPHSAFAAVAASVPAARRHVRARLEEMGLLAAWDRAEMLVSEVATNAVLHAKTAFTVEVVSVGERVRVCVADGSSVRPRPRSYGIESTTGRGLRLVASLSLDWGVESNDTGKTVWFEVLAAGDDEGSVEAWDADEDLEALLAAFDDDDDQPVRAAA